MSYVQIVWLVSLGILVACGGGVTGQVAGSDEPNVEDREPGPDASDGFQPDDQEGPLEDYVFGPCTVTWVQQYGLTQVMTYDQKGRLTKHRTTSDEGVSGEFVYTWNGPEARGTGPNGQTEVLEHIETARGLRVQRIQTNFNVTGFNVSNDGNYQSAKVSTVNGAQTLEDRSYQGDSGRVRSVVITKPNGNVEERRYTYDDALTLPVRRDVVSPGVIASVEFVRDDGGRLIGLRHDNNGDGRVDASETVTYAGSCDDTERLWYLTGTPELQR